MKNKITEIFKAYDIRGIVGETLNPKIIKAIGAAYTDTLNLAGHNVLIGYDMRKSSPEYANQFAQGCNLRGANTTILGETSTDELYFASGKYNKPGVMFTASHNPSQYNGIKLVKAGAQPISSENGLQQIQKQTEIYLTNTIPEHENLGTTSTKKVLKEYAEYLRELVNLTSIRNLKIVVDAGNGMAGLTTPAVLGNTLLEKLPIEIIELYFKLDGTFPNHPANPLEPENIKDLQKAVVEHKADMGIAFDGDADRCFIVDEKGNPITPSAITALVAVREIAKAKQDNMHNTGNIKIIHNLITSKAVPEIVLEHGAIPVRTRVGHSFIKDIMSKEQAIFGGEHSAHYYFKNFWNADTGMLAAMHVIAALGEKPSTLSELTKTYARYVESGEINTKIQDIQLAIDKVRQTFNHPDVECDSLDGLTFTNQNESWWFNLRPSNTEPYLRLNVEAENISTMTKIRDKVIEIIKG